MKVVLEDKKIIVYLFNYHFDFDDVDELNENIRKIFVKLMKRYHLNFFGYNKVNIYHNHNYGIVLEIENIYEENYVNGIIDLKIAIYKHSEMYLEFDDYYFLTKPKELIFKNNKYYLNVDNIDNINKYIEYGRIIIKKNY